MRNAQAEAVPTDDSPALPCQTVRHAVPQALPRDSPRYQLRGTIAAGGMGIVYHAYDLLLQRDVALKVDASCPWPSQGQLLNEARLAARLDHPNIVPIYELISDPALNLAGFAMKLIRGPSLTERIVSCGSSGDDDACLRAYLSILLRVCDAVSFAHSRDVLHLDLKPDNVMLEGPDRVYVIDWGIAGLGQRCPDGHLALTTQPASIRGTHAYMAPEQRERSTLDERTDVHGIGAILFHVLTGHAPFPDARDAQGASQRRPSAMRSWQQRLPRAHVLRSTVLRALSPAPADRHANVDELRSELAAALVVVAEHLVLRGQAGSDPASTADPQFASGLAHTPQRRLRALQGRDAASR